MRKKIKRIIVFALTVMLTVTTLGLAACGDPGGDPPPSAENNFRLELTELTLYTDELSLAVGKTASFEAELVRKEGGEASDGTVSYSSSNGTVGSFNGSVFTALSQGETTVTVSGTRQGFSGSVSLSYSVTVTDQPLTEYSDQSCVEYGRNYLSGGYTTYINPMSGADVAFSGTEISLTLKNPTAVDGRVKIFIDGDDVGEYVLLEKNSTVTYTKSGLNDINHVVRAINVFEDGSAFQIIEVDAQGYQSITREGRLSIEFVGDSITTGYQVIHNEDGSSNPRDIYNSDASLAFAYLTARELNADFSMIGRQGMTVGSTKQSDNMLATYGTASVHASSVLYDNPGHDVVVINLGTNDASKIGNGYANASAFCDAYFNLLLKVRDANPDARIICAYGMMGTNEIIKQNIELAIMRFNDVNVTALFDFTAAYDGHPNESEAKAAADVLTAYIRAIISE